MNSRNLLCLILFFMRISGYDCTLFEKLGIKRQAYSTKQGVLVGKRDLCAGKCWAATLFGPTCRSKEDVCPYQVHYIATNNCPGACSAQCPSSNSNYITRHCCYCQSTPAPPPSPPPPPPPPQSSSSGGGCFSSTARVSLVNGKQITINELQVGDRVQTGIATYHEVTAFLTKQPNAVAQYTSIVTLNKTLTLTGNHLIYARSHFEKRFKPIYAGQLLIDDEVLVQGIDKLRPVKVINIYKRKEQNLSDFVIVKNSNVAEIVHTTLSMGVGMRGFRSGKMRVQGWSSWPCQGVGVSGQGESLFYLEAHNKIGAYVPLTTEGMIMVNGVLASCYGDFHQDLAHFAMAPMQ